MILLLVGLGLIVILIGIYFSVCRDDAEVAVVVYPMFLLLVYLMFLLLLPISTCGGINAPINEYPYEASVELRGNEQLTTICFGDFTQEGAIVTIKKYAIPQTLHWTDFKKYDVYSVPLKIQLLDNDGMFIYEDRESGEVFNEAELAVQ
jgi:hypothetical protein